MKKLHLILHLINLITNHFKLEKTVENAIKLHEYFETIPLEKLLTIETIHGIFDLFGIKHDDKEVNNFFRSLCFLLFGIIKIL